MEVSSFGSEFRECFEKIAVSLLTKQSADADNGQFAAHVQLGSNLFNVCVPDTLEALKILAIGDQREFCRRHRLAIAQNLLHHLGGCNDVIGKTVREHLECQIGLVLRLALDAEDSVRVMSGHDGLPAHALRDGQSHKARSEEVSMNNLYLPLTDQVCELECRNRVGLSGSMSERLSGDATLFQVGEKAAVLAQGHDKVLDRQLSRKIDQVIEVVV